MPISFAGRHFRKLNIVPLHTHVVRDHESLSRTYTNCAVNHSLLTLLSSIHHHIDRLSWRLRLLFTRSALYWHLVLSKILSSDPIYNIFQTMQKIWLIFSETMYCFIAGASRARKHELYNRTHAWIPSHCNGCNLGVDTWASAACFVSLA